MKKHILVYFFLISVSFFAFSAEQVNFQDFELDTLIHSIEKPGAPIITEDYIIFTCAPNYRYVGIAFDFENYQTIHPFQILSRKDDEENVSRHFMFYCYKRQHEFTTLKYRLVFDGLWTKDPLNPNFVYDDNVNLYFSVVNDPDSVKIYTKNEETSGVKFIYRGESGQKIHLAGTFTSWDPWIYELKETSSGIYELTLPLTKGKYYYTYYIGLTPVLDNTNSQKIYTADGRVANVITVD